MNRSIWSVGFLFMMISAGCNPVGSNISTSGVAKLDKPKWATNQAYPRILEDKLQILVTFEHNSFVYANNEGIDSVSTIIITSELGRFTRDKYKYAAKDLESLEFLRLISTDYTETVLHSAKSQFFRDRTYWNKTLITNKSKRPEYLYRIWALYFTPIQNYNEVQFQVLDDLTSSAKPLSPAQLNDISTMKTSLEIAPAP